jgi:hypothetical protein
METKKVYVIDRSGDFNYTEKLREILGCSEDTEIICVQTLEQIPLEVRLKEEILREEGLKHESLIEEINEIKMCPRMEELCRIKSTYKGHERPYKYHK